MAKVSYRDAQGRLREHPLGGRTTIGRHPDQHIQVLDRVVSKEHALIELQPDGQGGQQYVIQDPGSRNGTYVNGVMIEGSRLLQDGDLITIGSTELSFHGARAGVTRPAPAGEFDRRVTIQSDGLETHIRSRLAQELEGRFAPESEIHDINLLRRDYEKLRTAYELSQAIGPQMDLGVLLEQILDKALEIFPADRGVILMRSDQDSELVPMVAKSAASGDLLSENVSISRTIVNTVLEEKEALLSSDAMMDSRFSKAHSIILEQIRSTMSVPLLREDEVLGLIHLDSKIARGAFTEKDLQLLSSFARQAALMIEHSRLIKKMRDEILVREQLHRLLSPHLVEEVVSGRLQLETTGGEMRRVTMLFADIRGFTPLSESMGAQELVHLLNDYFERMVDVIFKYEGTLDKFIGDEIMALWGAPIGHGDDALRAVRCAVEMQQALEAFNEERRQRGEVDLKVGIGVNTGEVVAGYMGSTKSMSYTVMGDTVNVASRLCSAAHSDDVYIGEETYRDVAEVVVAEKLPPTKLKGKGEHVEIYRVAGVRDA